VFIYVTNITTLKQLSKASGFLLLAADAVRGMLASSFEILAALLMTETLETSSGRARSMRTLRTTRSCTRSAGQPARQPTGQRFGILLSVAFTTRHMISRNAVACRLMKLYLSSRSMPASDGSLRYVLNAARGLTAPLGFSVSEAP